MYSVIATSQLNAQTIVIDSTFSSYGEILPFSQNDTIYGLSISGSINLFSDTSLVRVILSDTVGNEWMVYEAYPMIVSATSFDIVEECDETCYLDEFVPYSISIQVINAEFDFDSVNYSIDGEGDLSELQYQAKRDKDLFKIQVMNQYIINRDWNWTAGVNYFTDLYYQEKRKAFGTKYNLLGYEYYVSGIYKDIKTAEIYIDNSSLVKEFDWRSKHDADLTDSEYFDENPDLPQVYNGWITSVKNQEPCWACSAFGSVAALEAITNLYFNYHTDAELNIQLSERDAFNCSPFNSQSQNVGCICETGWGKDFESVLDYITTSGIVDEDCFPWKSPYCVGEIPDCSPVYSQKCSEEDQIVNVKPTGYDVRYKNPPSTLSSRLKSDLIEEGPLMIIDLINPTASHVYVIVGFGEDETTGELYWNCKNSYGAYAPYHQNSGYISLTHTYLLGHLWNTYYSFQNEIITIPTDFFGQEPRCLDKDNDGYMNWGIGIQPQNCTSCLEDAEEDWNDNNNRIGPRDDYYYGQPVKPEMVVTIGTLNPYIINNKDFYFFEQEQTTIRVDITNQGNAQLNLALFNTIEIAQDYNYYWLEGPPDQLQLCMEEGATSFEIGFDTDNPEVTWTAVVRIYLDLCDYDVYNPCFEFTLVYNGCGFDENPMIVEGFELIEDYTLMPRSIEIKDGGTLKVTGSMAMNELSEIIVEPGGQLVVDGGLITGSCRELWKGINIWGDPGQPQTLEYQGMVKVIDGGCIEHAEIAIETGNYSIPERYPSGGVISCSDAIFRDNVKDIVMYPYTNYHPLTKKILANMSRFNRTRFETTNNLKTVFYSNSYSHIVFYEVDGMTVTGCTFGNYHSGQLNYRGNGIESHSAGYLVSMACTEDGLPTCPELAPSRFENLNYGIKALNSNSLFTIKVDSAEFSHNFRGIYLSLVEHPTIIKSTFEISDPENLLDAEDTLIGFYLDAFTTGYSVQENDFIGPSSYALKTYGIHILNNGTDQNEIYNNSFTSLYRGIMAVGENRNGDEDFGGLCIKCNDFNDCMNDIIVTPEMEEGNQIITENTGIAKRQGILGYGADDLAAGNTFSVETGVNYANEEGCGHIDYTYHGDNPDEANLNPDYSGHFQPIRDDNATYTKEGSCPSHLGGSIDLAVEKNSLNSEEILISAYRDTLAMTIDGGSTEALNYEVISSLPEEALVLRQDLLAESPYLSDTVMVSAIQNEEVLPAAMVRDILVVNPQASKSKQVMSYLEQRQDTMPGYMMDEIMQGMSVFGAKELLEQNLGNHIARRDKAWNNLNRFYKTDTIFMEASYDSLISLLQNEGKLQSKYDLAFVYLSKEDSLHLFETLDSIPSGFDMTYQELSVHNLYLDLFDLLWEIHSDTTTMDSLQIESLFDLSESYHTLPGIYASNLLIKDGLINYVEPVYDVNVVKSANASIVDHNREKELKHLIVFPNPAGTYFIAAYDITEFQNAGLLSIYDIGGKKLKTIRLKDKQNQVVIPVTDLPAGVYLVKLYSGNFLVDAQKITQTN